MKDFCQKIGPVCALMGLMLALPGYAADPSGPNVVCAASDTPAALRDGAAFVCAADDARPVLQAALNRAAELEVKCLLLPGTYVVNSRGEHSPKGGIVFPNLATNGSGRAVSFVTLEGLVSPHGAAGAVVKMGRRLYDAIGTNEVFSLFYCDGGRVGSRSWAIRNLYVLLPENQKPIVVFDGRYCGALAYENLTARAFDLPWKLDHRTGVGVPPAHPGCVAFRGTCGSNSGVNTTWRVLSACGFGVGFDIGGEHVYCECLAAYYNTWGFRFNCYKGKERIRDGEDAPRWGVEVYPNYCVDLLDEHSTNLPVFGDEGSYLKEEIQSPSITIRALNIQWPNVCLGYTNRNASAFTAGRSRARETRPGFWRGSVEYVIDHTTEGCGVNFVHKPYFEPGHGLNVTCRNLTDRLRGDSKTRRGYDPNPMQQYYDTDLKKMLFYDGAVWRDFQGAEPREDVRAENLLLNPSFDLARDPFDYDGWKNDDRTGWAFSVTNVAAHGTRSLFCEGRHGALWQNVTVTPGAYELSLQAMAFPGKATGKTAGGIGAKTMLFLTSKADKKTKVVEDAVLTSCEPGAAPRWETLKLGPIVVPEGLADDKAILRILLGRLRAEGRGLIDDVVVRKVKGER